MSAGNTLFMQGSLAISRQPVAFLVTRVEVILGDHKILIPS